MGRRKRNIEVIEGEILTESTDGATSTHEDTAQETAKRVISRNLSMVSKSNDLIQKTRYSLPRTQQKLLLAMISKIDSQLDTDYTKIYTMTFGEFSKLTGMDLKNTGYKQYMLDVLADLASSVFWMDVKNAQNDKSKLFRWIGEEAEIDYKNKEIHIQFSKNIFPYLTQLKSNYTSFNVEFLLHMNSTYSMRFYEILKSYDNGDANYGYTNNIVFQPVTEAILDKFPEKAGVIKDYKYKVFDINDLKEQLSPAPTANDNSNDPKNRPLTEKYANFSDFERYVLKKAQAEINQFTDLWFTYIPVRLSGYGRSFKRIYLFIKYKTDKEMETVYSELKKQEIDEEKPRKESAAHAAAASQEVASHKAKKDDSSSSLSAIPDSVFSLSPTRAYRLIETKADAVEIQKLIEDESLLGAISGAFTYTSRLLTNTKNEKKAQIAHDTRDALNRIIEQDGSLKYWAIGMGNMLKQKSEAGLLKTPQYNAIVVFNAIDDYQILQDGKQIYERLSGGQPNIFKQNWMNQFDD